MTIQEAIYCMKVYVEDGNCESCPFFYDDNAGDCIANASRLAIEALEKQIPKQVKEIHVDEYFCPACGSENNTNGAKVVGHKYCPECGQKLLANQ